MDMVFSLKYLAREVDLVRLWMRTNASRSFSGGNWLACISSSFGEVICLGWMLVYGHGLRHLVFFVGLSFI